MTFAIYATPSITVGNTTYPISEVSVRRDTENKVTIFTQTPLTDDQMRDLYWLAYAMQKTGKTLKEIMTNETTVYG